MLPRDEQEVTEPLADQKIGLGGNLIDGQRLSNDPIFQAKSAVGADVDTFIGEVEGGVELDRSTKSPKGQSPGLSHHSGQLIVRYWFQEF